MYRLISLRSVPTLKLTQLTLPKCFPMVKRMVFATSSKVVNPSSVQKADYLLFSRRNSSIRFQSTTAEDSVVKRKQPRKSQNSKYIELLEVTNSATTETTAKVKKLKAKKLSDFIKSPIPYPIPKTIKKNRKSKRKNKWQPVEYQKVNLEMLENPAIQNVAYDERPLIFFKNDKPAIVENPLKVQEILKSFNHFKELIETIEHDEHDESVNYRDFVKTAEADNKVLPNEMESIEVDLEDIPTIEVADNSANIKKESASRYKSKYHKTAEHEKQAKRHAILVNLISYLNVCVSTGMLNRGFATLLSYRQRYKKLGKIISIDLYNILIHGYAETGNMAKIQEICAIIKEDDLNFNYQTFAGVLECLGRLEPTDENIEMIKKYLDKAEEMGISPNLVLDKSVFQHDQKDIIIDAIRRIYPDFIPDYTLPDPSYSNLLLNRLNKKTSNLNIDQDYKSNKNNYKIMESKRGYTSERLEEFAKEQLQIELEGSVTVKSIAKIKEYENSKHCRKMLEDLQNVWRSQITFAVNRDLNTLRAQTRFRPNGCMTYYTYLKALDVNEYVDILLKEIQMLAEGSETYSPTVGQLHRGLGQKVHARYQIELKKRNGVLDKMGEIYSSYTAKWENCTSNDNPRQIWQHLVHETRTTGPSMDINEVVWPSNVLAGVGRFLYNILMRDIKIDANIMRTNTKNKSQNLLPAFYTLFRNQARVVKEEVKPHPVLSRLLRASRQKTLTFDANLVPMLCPPQPWSTPVNGGYLITKSELIRLPHQAIQQWARINDANPQQLYPALDSLNQLASIPWRVNNDILDVILDVFNNGGDSKLNVPQPPSSLPPLPSIPAKNTNISNAERAKLFRQKMGHRRKQAEMYSLWCDTLYRLSLANHYRDKVFWLPHNMDFRGRVYPIPPHLNHLGSDLARSMLVFDQEKPLGVDGFTWLKLHCINLTGTKKRDSITERLLYAEQIMDEIIDSADNPLTGRRWWTKSDEPWQTLACCMEIAKVSRCPDPEKYMSRFPIHQDGSCNGLQHYAALGRDKSGAISVNLALSPVPQDVYSTVAALVEKSRLADAANDLHVAQILDGYVRRKVIKQTVMTTVYGVTRYGARLQIARQLKDIDGFPKEWVWPASTYLTTKTFESLREMFTSTKEIQDWFTECARLISAVCGQNVEWVTPLGLPVVQPYNRCEYKHVQKNSSKVAENMSSDMYEKPNVMKQKNAFPPNFIHSLDSSHMMLTSLFCEQEGITFISVHDCFWTHACTVPDMNRICREQFVALHSQPILEDLSEFLIKKYSYNDREFRNDGSIADLTKRKLNKVIQQLPEKGDFNLNEILKSVYFFS